jgi:hypothetical protein
MGSFVQKHQSDVIGVLSGFDRLVLRRPHPDGVAPRMVSRSEWCRALT